MQGRALKLRKNACAKTLHHCTKNVVEVLQNDSINRGDFSCRILSRSRWWNIVTGYLFVRHARMFVLRPREFVFQKAIHVIKMFCASLDDIYEHPVAAGDARENGTFGMECCAGERQSGSSTIAADTKKGWKEFITGQALWYFVKF